MSNNFNYTTPVHSSSEYTNDLQVWIDVLSNTEFDGRTGTTGATNYALYPTNQSPPGVAFAILKDWITAQYLQLATSSSTSLTVLNLGGYGGSNNQLIFTIRNEGFTFSSMSTQFGGESGLAFTDMTALFQGWSTDKGFSNIQLPPNSALFKAVLLAPFEVSLLDSTGAVQQTYALSVSPTIPPDNTMQQFPTAVFSRAPMPLTAVSYTLYPYTGSMFSYSRVNFEIPVGWTLRFTCDPYFASLGWNS
jgi:ABC-type antimicrobial peptide transport system permease subunit